MHSVADAHPFGTGALLLMVIGGLVVVYGAIAFALRARKLVGLLKVSGPRRQGAAPVAIQQPGNRSLRYLNIAVSEQGLAEMSGNRRIVFISKDRVQSIEIRFGPRAERPCVQGTAGLAFLGLGAAGLYALIGGGLAALRGGLGFLLFGGLGGWLLWEATRRRHYLWVVCSGDTRKLVFNGNVQTAELSAFVAGAAQLGYSFRDCLAHKKPCQ